jgi:hypothetical protein
MKIKHKIITISLIILTVFTTILTPAKATTNDVLYKWSRTYGSIDPDSTVAIAEGTDGSIYVTGYFTDTVDFDGTAGVDNKTTNGANDVFISKYNSNGSYGWSQTFGGNYSDYPTGIAVGIDGSIYITGYFSDTVDFDGTAGVDNKTSNGSVDVFISKYNGDGSYGWTITVGGTGYESASAISLGTDGSIYVTGSFENTVDFDGTAGVDNKTSNGSDDIFISKYNADGSYGWSRTFGGSDYEYGFGIAVGTEGSIYITGYFSDTVDFDGTAGVDNKTSNGDIDVFISKYNADGSYGWTRTFGGSEYDSGNDITVGTDGSIYITGYFTDTVDFDGTAGVDNKTSNGSDDIFISKYNANGSYGWSRTFGGNVNDYGNSIAVGLNGSIYVTGEFNNTVDFDGTAGVDNKTTNGANDVFISKYNADGSYGWSRTFGGSGNDYGNGIAVGMYGSIYVTGRFENTVDFDFTAGVDNRTSNGYQDSFITKLQQSLATPWTQNGGLTSHAIATKAFDGKIYQAIKGNSTNTIYVRSSTDGINWSSWDASGVNGQTNTYPSLEVYNNRLYIAVRGNSGEVFTKSMGTNGVWDSSWVQNGGATGSAIGMAAHTVGMEDRLYQTIKGISTNLIYIRYTIDGTFDGSSSNENWSTVMNGGTTAQTPTTPEIRSFGGKLYMSVRGNSGNINIASSTNGLFNSGETFAMTGGLTADAQSLVVHNGKLYQTVRGNGTTKIYLRNTTNGTSWTDWEEYGGNSPTKIGMESFGGKLHQVVRGNSGNIFVRQIEF